MAQRMCRLTVKMCYIRMLHDSVISWPHCCQRVDVHLSGHMSVVLLERFKLSNWAVALRDTATETNTTRKG